MNVTNPTSSRTAAPAKQRHSPKVTVLLCAYNDGPYLLRSVGSILYQTFDDMEFLVVDDGSSDDTRDVLRTIEDPRLQVIHQDHRGLVPSLAFGLSMARGEYVARIDGDDRSGPDRLRRQVEFLEGHPDHVLVGTWWRVRDLEGRVLDEYRSPVEDLGLRWQILFDLCFPQSSFLIRRSALEQVGGYDPHFEFSQDYDLVARLASVGRIAAIPEVLTDWQLDHRDGRSIRHRAEQRRYSVEVSSRELDRLLGSAAMDEADLDALYRVADQPWTVGVERSARARRWLPRIARAFVERHGPGAREAVRSALARTAEALLRARAPSRRVFLARWMLAFRISPGVACSPGLAVRGLVRLLSGKAV